MATMTTDEAEALAIQALLFIGSNQETLGRFLDITGNTADGIREAAADPGFLRGVLQYVMAWEPLLLELAEGTGIPVDDYVKAAHALDALEQA